MNTVPASAKAAASMNKNPKMRAHTRTIITAIFPNIFTAILLVALAGGFGLTRIELMFVYMNKFIPSQQRATVLSSISMFKSFALVLLNPFIGFAADNSIRLALLVVALLPLSVFLFSPINKENLESKI